MEHRESHESNFQLKTLKFCQISRRRTFRYSPWLASMAKTQTFHRKKGIRFGGNYNPVKNGEVFNRYNYKRVHLPFQVGKINMIHFVVFYP